MLMVKRSIIIPHKTGSMFTSKWDDPYVPWEVCINDAYKIASTDGVRTHPLSSVFPKFYYP